MTDFVSVEGVCLFWGKKFSLVTRCRLVYRLSIKFVYAA